MSETRTWSEEVRFRLVTWGLWASGAQLYRNPSSIIAAMIERAAGELPGDDLSVPLDMTFEIHVVEKALARMKLSSFSRDRQARKLLMRIYLHAVDPIDLQVENNWTAEMRQAQQWRAESIVGRYMTELEKDPALLAQYKKSGSRRS